MTSTDISSSRAYAGSGSNLLARTTHGPGRRAKRPSSTCFGKKGRCCLVFRHEGDAVSAQAHQMSLPEAGSPFQRVTPSLRRSCWPRSPCSPCESPPTTVSPPAYSWWGCWRACLSPRPASCCDEGDRSHQLSCGSAAGPRSARCSRLCGRYRLQLPLPQRLHHALGAAGEVVAVGVEGQTEFLRHALLRNARVDPGQP